VVLEEKEMETVINRIEISGLSSRNSWKGDLIRKRAFGDIEDLAGK
jgi:hypothetical protein